MHIAGVSAESQGHYTLTPVSEASLVPSSPTFFGGRLDMMIANQNQPIGFLDPLKKAVCTNASQIYQQFPLIALLSLPLMATAESVNGLLIPLGLTQVKS